MKVHCIQVGHTYGPHELIEGVCMLPVPAVESVCFVKGCTDTPTWRGIYRDKPVVVCDNDKWRIPFLNRTKIGE